MSILTSVEAAFVVLAMLALVVVAFVWARRARIASTGPVMVCALRTPAEPRWRLGLLRLSGERLDWFSVIGPTARPEFSWGRHEVDFGAPHPVREAIPGLGEAVALDGTASGAELNFALERTGSMALRAWLESSPPGFNVNVA